MNKHFKGLYCNRSYSYGYANVGYPVGCWDAAGPVDGGRWTVDAGRWTLDAGWSLSWARDWVRMEGIEWWRQATVYVLPFWSEAAIEIQRPLIRKCNCERVGRQALVSLMNECDAFHLCPCIKIRCGQSVLRRWAKGHSCNWPRRLH